MIDDDCTDRHSESRSEITLMTWRKLTETEIF